MAKKISLFLLLLLSIVGFGHVRSDEVHAAEVDSVTIHLHKLVYDFGEMPVHEEDLIENTGNEIKLSMDLEPLAGVTFSVFDVTDAFYSALEEAIVNAPENNQDYDPAEIAIEAVKVNPADGINPLTTRTTSFTGTAVFNLPAKSGGRDAVYMFHEESRPNGILRGSANIVITLPAFDPIDGDLLEVLHLYPKNERAPRLPDTGGKEEPTPSDPETPIERPVERPVLRLPRTGEWTNVTLSIIGIIFISTASYILLKVDKEKEEN